MPDFTYVAYRPVVTRALPAHLARDLTIKAMALQARSSIGRRIFKWMAAAKPAPELRLRALGLEFPGPVGVAPNVDLGGEALRLWPSLGAGFTIVGPVTTDAGARASLPHLIHDLCAIVTSSSEGFTDLAMLSERLADPLARQTPVGVSVRGSGVEGLLRALDDRADFFVVPMPEDDETLRAWRSATRRPLLIELGVEIGAEQALRLGEQAIAAGVEGVIVACGARSDVVPGGRIHGPYVRDAALALVSEMNRAFGSKLAIVGCGGIMTPEDAVAFLDAGATLVQIFEGFIYAGPGLLRRVNELVAGGRVAIAESTTALDVSVARSPKNFGWLGAALAGLLLILGGIGASALAATQLFLSYEISMIGASPATLASSFHGPLLPFIAHNRVCLSGALICLGILYGWLAFTPLRARESWAWWALFFSGIGGSAVLATALYLKGIRDPYLYGIQAFISSLVAVSLALAWPTLQRGHRSPRSVLVPGAKAWLWSPASRGRALVGVWGVGLLSGGFMILGVGLTQTLVPQDVEFLGFGVHTMHEIHHGVVPAVAKDRIAFGGCLFAAGLAALPMIWCGLRPGRRSLLAVLAIAMTIEVGLAVGVHPLIGYVDFVHLAPFIIKGMAFTSGVGLLYRSLEPRKDASRFPDLWVDVGAPVVKTETGQEEQRWKTLAMQS